MTRLWGGSGRDYEVVGGQGHQQESHTWKIRVAKLFKWVPQYLEIPWRTSKKQQDTKKIACPTSDFVTRSELSNYHDKDCVTKPEPSNCQENTCVTRSELSNSREQSRPRLASSRLHSRERLQSGLEKTIPESRQSDGGQNSVTVRDSSWLDQTPPLTTHQTRVLKSLEKINIPAWFRPSSKPSKQRQSHHSDTPGWKRNKETPIEATVTPDVEPTGHQWLSSRETSTCPSFSSCHSRWSSTHQAYRSRRDGSIQSWQAPAIHSYKQPYLGWRSHHPHKESTPYLLPPPQRLANSAARD